jgi:hypothetical protein
MLKFCHLSVAVIRIWSPNGWFLLHYNAQLVIGGQKAPCQAQCDDFAVSSILSGHVIAQLFPVSVTKKFSERTIICECQGSHYKSDECNDRGIKK